MSIMTLASSILGKDSAILRNFRQTDYPRMLAALKDEASAFRQTHEARSETSPNDPILNCWMDSIEGMDCLNALTRDIHDYIASYPLEGAPGHDKRHIYKDLASSLRIVAEEGWQRSWLGALVIPSLLHDSGRLIEEAVVGQKLAGVDPLDHAFISYEQTKEFLDHYPAIPTPIRDEILYAVLTHAEGKGRGPMAQAVARADREQLVGGEVVARFLQRDVSALGVPLATDMKPGDPLTSTSIKDASYLKSLSFYARNLYSNMGRNGEARAAWLKARTLVVVSLASRGNGEDALADPERRAALGLETAHWSAKPVPDAVQAEMGHIAKRAEPFQHIAVADRETVPLLTAFAQSPVSTLSSYNCAMLQQAAEALTPLARQSLARGALLAQEFRAESDLDDKKLLTTLTNDPAVPSYLRSMAEICAKGMGCITSPVFLGKQPAAIRTYPNLTQDRT